MNYSQSAAILEKIKKSKKILLNTHRSPDSDSVGSTLAFSHGLKKLGAQSHIICPDPVDKRLFFLEGATAIETINYETFNFSEYDLFILLDSAGWEQITDRKDFKIANLPLIVIDHHITNNIEAEIRLVDSAASATAEIVYKLLADWNVAIDSQMASCLFAGLADDTVGFKYTHDAKSVYGVASALINLGADKDRFIYEMYNNYDIASIKLLGKILDEMRFDESNAFVWSAISYDVYEQYGKPESAKEIAANLFFQSVKQAEFGIIMVEKEPGKISISFRSKGKVNIATLAQKLGGGGHHNAAGCTIKGDFKENVKKILEAAQNHKS